MYVHPIVRDSMIVWNYYHALALPLGTWLGSGSKYGIDMHVGQVWGERFHISRCKWTTATLVPYADFDSISKQSLDSRVAIHLLPLDTREMATRNTNPSLLHGPRPPSSFADD